MGGPSKSQGALPDHGEYELPGPATVQRGRTKSFSVVTTGTAEDFIAANRRDVTSAAKTSASLQCLPTSVTSPRGPALRRASDDAAPLFSSMRTEGSQAAISVENEAVSASVSPSSASWGSPSEVQGLSPVKYDSRCVRDKVSDWERKASPSVAEQRRATTSAVEADRPVTPRSSVSMSSAQSAQSFFSGTDRRSSAPGVMSIAKFLQFGRAT